MTAVRLGDYLREAREKSGLSLEQLAERTRVRLDNLAALEREDLDALPADAYVRGFVKIVCRELRLPPEEGMALYSKLRSSSGLPDEIVWSEESIAKEPGALDKALQDPERVISVARKAKKWALPVGALVLTVIIALVVRGAGVVAEEGGEAHVAPPSESVSERAGKSSANSADVSPAHESAERLLAKLDAPPAKVETTTPPEPPESRPAMIREAVRKEKVPQAAQDTASASLKSSPESVAAAPESTRESTGLITEPDATFAPLEPLVLEIEAIREAEVTLLLDGGGFPRKRNLITGERKSWKADSLFVISASDAGAIRIILDGVDLGSPGEAGSPLANHVVRR